MSTVDHKASHVWARTPHGIRCGFMWCDARPEPAEVGKLETEEAQRRATRMEIRYAR